jgi:hypothetical protein
MLVVWLRTVAAKCVTSVAEAIVFCGTVAAKLATDLARVPESDAANEPKILRLYRRHHTR